MNGRKEGIEGGEVVGVKRKIRARNKKRGQWSRGGEKRRGGGKKYVSLGTGGRVALPGGHC